MYHVIMFTLLCDFIDSKLMLMFNLVLLSGICTVRTEKQTRPVHSPEVEGMSRSVACSIKFSQRKNILGTDWLLL